jgi:hypothetical protein
MASKFEVCLELQGALAQLCERSSTTLILDTPQDVLGLRVAAARQLNVTAHLGGLRVWQHSQLLESDHMMMRSATLQLSLELSDGEKALLNLLESKSCALVEATEALAKHKKAHELQLAEEMEKRSRLQAVVDGIAAKALATRKDHDGDADMPPFGMPPPPFGMPMPPPPVPAAVPAAAAVPAPRPQCMLADGPACRMAATWLMGPSGCEAVDDSVMTPACKSGAQNESCEIQLYFSVFLCQASQSAVKMHRGIETTSLREARILPTGFFHDRSCVSQRIFQMRFGDGSSLRVGMYS